MLNEGLGVKLLLEPFHLGFELHDLPGEELGLEGDRPAMAHQRRTHAPSGSPAASTVTPDASRFALTGPLRRYGRLKGLGLPDRYRLFFRPFEAEDRRLLLILWLGFSRRDGDRNDCYAMFSRLVQRGELPQDWKSLQSVLDAD